MYSPALCFHVIVFFFSHSTFKWHYFHYSADIQHSSPFINATAGEGSASAQGAITMTTTVDPVSTTHRTAINISPRNPENKTPAHRNPAASQTNWPELVQPQHIAITQRSEGDAVMFYNNANKFFSLSCPQENCIYLNFSSVWLAPKLWLDKWLNSCIDRCIDGWLNGWMDGRTSECVNNGTVEWVTDRKNELMRK